MPPKSHGRPCQWAGHHYSLLDLDSVSLDSLPTPLFALLNTSYLLINTCLLCYLHLRLDTNTS